MFVDVKFRWSKINFLLRVVLNHDELVSFHVQYSLATFNPIHLPKRDKNCKLFIYSFLLTFRAKFSHQFSWLKRGGRRIIEATPYFIQQTTTTVRLKQQLLAGKKAPLKIERNCKGRKDEKKNIQQIIRCDLLIFRVISHHESTKLSHQHLNIIRILITIIVFY